MAAAAGGVEVFAGRGRLAGWLAALAGRLQSGIKNIAHGRNEEKPLALRE
jgi:hypothetical protein